MKKPPRFLKPALVCAIYFLLHTATEYIGQNFMIGPHVGVRYAPGLALALLALYGLRYTPAVFAAYFYSFCYIDVPPEHFPPKPFWLHLALALIATSGFAVVAGLVRRRFGPAPIPKNRRQSLALIAAAFAAPLPWAVLGSLVLFAGRFSSADQLMPGILLRWIGSTVSILTIVPAVAVHLAPWLFSRPRPERHPGRYAHLEVAGQILAVLLSLWLVQAWAPIRALHVFYLCFVPLVWIGLRWGLSGATWATLAINLAGYLSIWRMGPTTEVGIDFLLFALSLAIVGLGLGAAVSFRNQAETALADSEARFARVLAGAQLGLWDCDLPSGRVTVNHAWARMLGYSMDQLSLTAGWWENMIHSEDRTRVSRLLEEHLSGQTPFFEAEYRMQMRDSGSTKWVHARGSVVSRDETGSPLRFSGTHTDLTERKRAESEKNRLLEIIEAAPDFIGTFDLEHRTLYANPALLRLSGLPDLPAALARRLTDYHPGWAAKKMLEIAVPAALEQGIWIGEAALLDAQGRETPVSQLILVQCDDLGRPAFISIIARDISAQKQAEAERLATERKMLQAQKLESLGVLAGGIAHDFNNLLTVMLGNASLAQLDLPVGLPAAGHVQQIKDAAVRAAELCKQLLAYSGKGQFSATLIDLSALVEDTTHLLQVSISKKCVLKFDLERGLPPVRADATQLRQIVMNLVINASDAIGERSGLIRITTGLMRVGAAYMAETYLAPDLQPGDYVLLEVSDNGCGMAPDVKSRIFEPFFTTKFAGRGLGLAAVLGIVRGHRGALKVYSEPGRGTTFKMLLPTAEGMALPPAQSAAAGVAPRGRGTILVVDDEETVRVVAARILESQGYRTALAADGREAVRIFRERPDRFDAVLLDLTMPHMNGEETYREIRRLDDEVPVVLMSGFSEKDSVDRFAGRGLAGFIPKPFERDTLLAKVRAALQLKI